MTQPRKLTASLEVAGDSISGVVTDQDGTRRPFAGWLELIGLLQAQQDGHDQSQVEVTPE